MKVSLQVTPKLTLTVEGENTFEVFKQIAAASQVFDVAKCGCCQSDNIKFVVRTASDEKGKKTFYYPEMHCQKCFARLSFGQTDDGQLYPKQKMSQLAIDKSESDAKRAEENKEHAEKNYGWLKDRGWYKFKKED